MKAPIIVRALTTDADGRTIPVVPDAWDLQVDASGFFQLWPLGRERPDIRIAAYLALTDGTDGAFIIHAEPEVLRRLLDLPGVTAATIAEIRASSSGWKKRVKDLWVDRRRLDEHGDPVGPLVAMYATLAGYDIPADMEATTEVPT